MPGPGRASGERTYPVVIFRGSWRAFPQILPFSRSQARLDAPSSRCQALLTQVSWQLGGGIMAGREPKLLRSFVPAPCPCHIERCTPCLAQFNRLIDWQQVTKFSFQATISNLSVLAVVTGSWNSARKSDDWGGETRRDPGLHPVCWDLLCKGALHRKAHVAC